MKFNIILSYFLTYLTDVLPASIVIKIFYEFLISAMQVLSLLVLSSSL